MASLNPTVDGFHQCDPGCKVFLGARFFYYRLPSVRPRVQSSSIRPSDGAPSILGLAYKPAQERAPFPRPCDPPLVGGFATRGRKIGAHKLGRFCAPCPTFVGHEVHPELSLAFFLVGQLAAISRALPLQGRQAGALQARCAWAGAGKVRVGRCRRGACTHTSRARVCVQAGTGNRALGSLHMGRGNGCRDPCKITRMQEHLRARSACTSAEAWCKTAQHGPPCTRVCLPNHTNTCMLATILSPCCLPSHPLPPLPLGDCLLDVVCFLVVMYTQTQEQTYTHTHPTPRTSIEPPSSWYGSSSWKSSAV